ncbi:MAG: phosphatidylserine decarboxylase family protein [Candidatus Binatia bacterium]
MKFAREGLPYVAVLGVATLTADLLGFWWLGLFLLLATLAVASFFRDPEREVPAGGDLVVSPADGKVVAVESGCSPESLPDEKLRRVSIFMSPADVHVNRVPRSGTVVSVKHTPGRFVAAYRDHASLENERNEVAVRDDKGRPIVFVQIAGLLARRIICRLTPGQAVRQGERFGLIMFGSRVDVYLPESAILRVRVGDRVRAGSGVIAEFPS